VKPLARQFGFFARHVREHGTSTRYFAAGAIDACPLAQRALAVSTKADVHFPFFFFVLLFSLPLCSSETVFYWEERPGMNSS